MSGLATGRAARMVPCSAPIRPLVSTIAVVFQSSDRLATSAAAIQRPSLAASVVEKQLAVAMVRGHVQFLRLVRSNVRANSDSN